MKNKHFIFDLDGTLVEDSKNSIKQEVIDLLALLKADFCTVGIATGRSYFESKEIIEQIKPNWFNIFYDGRLIITPDCESIILQYIPLSTIRSLITLYRGHHIIYETTDGIYCNDLVISYLFRLTFKINKKYIFISSYIPKNKRIIRVYVKQSRNLSFLNINQESFQDIEFYKPNPEWTIINSVSNKANALFYLEEYFKVQLGNITAFGDGINDLEMLKIVGRGVAMKNASEVIKNTAGNVAGSIYDNGILDFFKKDKSGTSKL